MGASLAPLSVDMSFAPLPQLGFIGAGRLARCLARRFARAGYPVIAITSKRLTSARSLAAYIDGCTAYPSPQAVIAAADIVFLAVPDDSLGALIASLHFPPARAARQALVHCSGTSSLDLLAPAHAQGVATGSFHPLYLFSGDATDLSRLDGCAVAIEAGSELNATLNALAATLGCQPLPIPAGGRVLYHAAAQYAASFTLCVLAECISLWRTLGLQDDEALHALLPLVTSAIDTARDKGLVNALSGPVARGDTGIVEQHLAVLEKHGGDHAALYALLTRRAIVLARERATPSPSLDALARAVETPLARFLTLVQPARTEP